MLGGFNLITHCSLIDVASRSGQDSLTPVTDSTAVLVIPPILVTEEWSGEGEELCRCLGEGEELRWRLGGRLLDLSLIHI